MQDSGVHNYKLSPDKMVMGIVMMIKMMMHTKRNGNDIKGRKLLVTYGELKQAYWA